MFKNACNKAVSNNFDAKYIQNSFKSVHGNGPNCVMHEVLRIFVVMMSVRMLLASCIENCGISVTGSDTHSVTSIML